MRFQNVLIAVLLAVYFVQGVQSWRRRRRRRSPPPCPVTNCQVSAWSSWSTCNHRCGSAGVQTRRRTKTVAEKCGGRCPYHFSESRACNRNACRNGGIPLPGSCRCKAGYTGTCCGLDVNECATQRPCQHVCRNTLGSFTCSCNACYTKLGTRCELRQCLIAGRCYAYGTRNPSNACQDCNRASKLAWTNNNALSCSDGNACTSRDRCVNGRCAGTPFTCLVCEQCQGGTCRAKPGFCVIVVNGRKTCFANSALRPGYQCQQCKSDKPNQWTNNDRLQCSDNNLKTKEDRCSAGACRGTPYTCLPCETHNGVGCPLNAGFCVIEHKGKRTCFANKQVNPENSCQWCNAAASTGSWSNRNNVSCDDGNACSRNDRCANGRCSGTPFTCAPHCKYCNGNTCSLTKNWAFVKGMCVDVLFCKNKGATFGYFTDPVDCSRFYQCAWGRAVLMKCPPGTRWNANIHICDLIANVPCSTAAPTSPGQTGTTPTLPVAQFCVNRSDGNYKHPNDCGKYITCSGHHTYEMSCPAGLRYNAANGSCDWPRNVDKC